MQEGQTDPQCLFGVHRFPPGWLGSRAQHRHSLQWVEELLSDCVEGYPPWVPLFFTQKCLGE